METCDNVFSKQTIRNLFIFFLNKSIKKCCKTATLFLQSRLDVRIRHAGEGSRRPSCLSVRGAGGAKVPFLNAMICFLIVNMIQRRSYKLKASNLDANERHSP